MIPVSRRVDTSAADPALRKLDAAAEAVERARDWLDSIATAVAALEPAGAQRDANVRTAAELSAVITVSEKFPHVAGDLSQPEVALRAVIVGAQVLTLLTGEFRSAEAAYRAALNLVDRSASPVH